MTGSVSGARVRPIGKLLAGAGLVIGAIAAIPPANGQNEEAEANRLLVEAVESLDEADRTHFVDERLLLLASAIQMLDEIRDDHPGSSLAVRLALGEPMGRLDVTASERQLHSLLTQAEVLRAAVAVEEGVLREDEDNRVCWLAAAPVITAALVASGQIEQAMQRVVDLQGRVREMPLMAIAEALAAAGDSEAAHDIYQDLLSTSEHITQLGMLVESALHSGDVDIVRRISMRIPLIAGVESMDLNNFLAPIAVPQLHLGDLAGAVETAKQITEFPVRVRTFLEMARYLHEQGQDALAVDLLAELIEGWESGSGAYENLMASSLAELAGASVLISFVENNVSEVRFRLGILSSVAAERALFGDIETARALIWYMRSLDTSSDRFKERAILLSESVLMVASGDRNAGIEMAQTLDRAAHRYIGPALARLGDLPWALSLVDEIGNEFEKGIAYQDIATVLVRRGEYSQALDAIDLIRQEWERERAYARFAEELVRVIGFHEALTILQELDWRRGHEGRLWSLARGSAVRGAQVSVVLRLQMSLPRTQPEMYEIVEKAMRGEVLSALASVRETYERDCFRAQVLGHIALVLDDYTESAGSEQ